MVYLPDSCIVLGDSMTEYGFGNNGLCALVSSAFGRRLDVLNRGYSGYNTVVASEIYKQIFPTREEQKHSSRVRLVVIWFGANDASLPGFPSKFHVPLDTFSDNITAIVRGLRDPASDHFLPDARVILITPPPVDPVRTKTEIYDMISHPRLVGLDRSDELVKQYARVTKEVGDREGVPVIDAYTTIWAKAGGRDASLLRPFFADGLHLNAEGNKVVFELLMETISSQYPELKPENLPLGFPEWDTLDFDNLASSNVRP